jgi:enamine deaminase RidA (YjgF/YER057c/UK114 family)
VSFDIINPEPLGRPSGWNHGMLGPAGGRVLFVAGQTAPGAGDLVAQWGGALERVLAVVRAARGAPHDIGRMTIYVTDKAAYLAGRPALGEVHRRLMGKHYPAMALVEVKALVDPGALVEIEATAVIS